jgi:hypothetical protein
VRLQSAKEQRSRLRVSGGPCAAAAVIHLSAPPEKRHQHVRIQSSRCEPETSRAPIICNTAGHWQNPSDLLGSSEAIALIPVSDYHIGLCLVIEEFADSAVFSL